MERFLCDWVNVPGPWPLENMDKQSLARFGKAIERLRHHWAGIFGESALGNLWLRDMLRRAWDTSDIREREWLCFRLRDAYATMVRRDGIHGEGMSIEDMRKEDLDVTGPRYAAPPITPFETAIFHFQRRKTARRCLNPDCAAPYFFAAKKAQQFCSPDCALPARLESKRRWWNENRGKSAKRRK